MKRRSGGMKKRCAGKNKKNMHESKSVRIGDVPVGAECSPDTN
jgi:hypothetical protein